MKKMIISALFLALTNWVSAQPDLIVESIRFATEPATGGPGLVFPTIYVTIKNNGTKPAVGTNAEPTKGYMIDLILSGDTYAPVRLAPLVMAGRYPEDCLLVGGRISRTETILPFQTYTYKIPGLSILKTVDMHNPCGIGKFNLGAVVDSNTKIRETNETNNTAFKEFKLVCR